MGRPYKVQSDQANTKWRYKRALVVGGGAKGLEFRSWCEKCLGSGGVPLPVAGGRRGCLDNEHEYWDDQRGTVRISTEQCLIARPGFPGTFPGSTSCFGWVVDGQCRDATIIAVPQTKADYQRQRVLDPQVWKPVGARDRLLLVQGD